MRGLCDQLVLQDPNVLRPSYKQGPGSGPRVLGCSGVASRGRREAPMCLELHGGSHAKSCGSLCGNERGPGR